MQHIRICSRSRAAAGRKPDERQPQLRPSTIPQESALFDRCGRPQQWMKYQDSPCGATAGAAGDTPAAAPALQSICGAAAREKIHTDTGHACITRDLSLSLDGDQQSDFLSSFPWDASTSTDSSVCWSTSSVASRPSSARAGIPVTSAKAKLNVQRPKQRRKGGSVTRPRRLSKTDFLDPPLPKPQRLPVDLTPYLTEAAPQIPEKSANTQTDAFEDRPKEAPYCSRKRGVDSSTQTAVGEELFCFEKEVAPLLDVLTWRTLEEAQTEVLHEDELNRLALYRQRCLTLQQERLQQQEEALKLERRRVERIRELKQLCKQRRDRERVVIQKLSAVEAVDTALLNSTVLQVLDKLQAAGAFVDDKFVAVETLSVPAILTRAAGSFRDMTFGRTLATQILKRSIKKDTDHMRNVCEDCVKAAWSAREDHKKVADIRRGRLHFILTAAGVVDVNGDIREPSEDTSTRQEAILQHKSSQNEHDPQSPAIDKRGRQQSDEGNAALAIQISSNASHSENYISKQGVEDYRGEEVGSDADAPSVFKDDVIIGPVVVVRTSELRDCIELEEMHERIWLWIREHIPLLEEKIPQGFDVFMNGKLQQNVPELLNSLPNSLFLKPRSSRKEAEDGDVLVSGGELGSQ